MKHKHHAHHEHHGHHHSHGHHAHHGHTKHDAHPHDHMAATVQFKEGHWEKPLSDVDTADTKYGSEFGQEAEYKHSVDALAAYTKRHKPAH